MKKGKFTTILLVLVFLIGLSLLLYPTVSDVWNSMHQSRAIADYREHVADLDNDVYAQLWSDAQSYNQTLMNRPDRFMMTDEEREVYEGLLNVSGNGVIGYIEILSIDCSLPIYHGTDEAVLQIAVGHIEGSSLPTGGEGTHCVLSGHRGLPSARLFTDLDGLVEGDTFILRILDEVLTYEVDQILVVEPDQVDALAIEEERDLCTLVTCTPYGINTHRLLVRGHRVENQAEVRSVRVTADAVQVEPMIVALAMAALMLFILLIGMLLKTRRRR